VPSAVVALTNVDTNVSQKATADASGVYRFASLPPRQGFQAQRLR